MLLLEGGQSHRNELRIVALVVSHVTLARAGLVVGQSLGTSSRAYKTVHSLHVTVPLVH